MGYVCSGRKQIMLPKKLGRSNIDELKIKFQIFEYSSNTMSKYRICDFAIHFSALVGVLLLQDILILLTLNSRR